MNSENNCINKKYDIRKIKTLIIIFFFPILNELPREILAQKTFFSTLKCCLSSQFFLTSCKVILRIYANLSA